MKRCIGALVASITLALSAGVSVASASGDEFVPPPNHVLGQSNESDQGQIQIVPIAPQLNVQNANVATFGDVEQGDANNANTGQASQQENTAAAPAPVVAQSNESDQEQIQIVPIAPQVNVQNVNIATHGDVEQGDANNANTGQANQQENTSEAGHSSPAPRTTCGSCSQPTSGGGQRNDSDQSQIQIVPIAPQVNVQNTNIATGGDVEQGDANNANTGQANQQENTNTSKAGHGSPAPSSKCGSCSKPSSGGWQKNDSDQSQIQIVPIAPQVNVQNVNIATHGDVEQGDVNNANTGQANQQENTSKGGNGSPAPSSKCGSCSQPTSGGGQKNDSDQKQIQIVPIAPQLNVQNVNLFTFGDVEQGDANNANTGQANQQKNTSSSGKGSACYSSCSPPKPSPCNNTCHPKPEPKPCGCQPPPKPCECQPPPKPCECKPAPKPVKKYKCGCGSKKGYGQSNRSSQKQIQFVPIAPQHNVQNFNLFTFGDVEQGDANNANTGQANQQKNYKSSSQPSYGKSAPWCGCGSKGSGQSNKSEQEQIQIVPIAPQHNFQNVNLFTFGDVKQGNANNANTGQANQQQNTLKSAAPQKPKPENKPPVSTV